MKKTIIASLFVVSAVSGCNDFGVTCDQNSPEVAFARSLSQTRLAKLAEDSRLLLTSNDLGTWGEHATPIPEQFLDLKPKGIRSHGRNVHIRLKGCMDHHIDLVVDTAPGKNQKIVLVWGEGPTSGKQELWHK